MSDRVQSGVVKVCTMTIGAKLTQAVDLNKVRQMDLSQSPLVLRLARGKAKPADTTYRQFNNQVGCTLMHPNPK